MDILLGIVHGGIIGVIYMMKIPLMKIVTTLQQILILRCMMQRMIMIPIMKMADMNKKAEI